MQLKLRHLLLFFIASLLFIFSRSQMGGLLTMLVLMQLNLLINNIELSKKSQIGALKLFLISVPLFFFWGAVHSFVSIYFREQQYFLSLMALAVVVLLGFLMNLQVVFSYLYLEKNNYELIATIQDAFNNIKSRQTFFIKTTFIIVLFSFIPWLGADWKLIFAIMATHCYLNPAQLKKAFLSF